VGPRAVLDVCRKSRPPPGFDSQAVQPTLSRYTNCTIPAPRETKVLVKYVFGNKTIYRESDLGPLNENASEQYITEVTVVHHIAVSLQILVVISMQLFYICIAS
jgi:hypothetical protein